MKIFGLKAVNCGLLLLVLSLASCLATFKFKPLQANPVWGDAYAIFRDDFPFEVSPKTKDVSTVIPPARPGCQVKLLPASVENFELKYYLLEKAQQSIKLQTYILYNDPVSRKAVDILLKRKADGIDIKLIADCYTKYIPKDQMLYHKMTKSGLDLVGYEPLYFSASGDHNYVIDGNEINMRFHEKYWIVDDQVGITGGTNISQEYAFYAYNPRFLWRDQDVVLTGPVVKDMARAFDDNYVYFSEKRMDRPDIINPQFYKQFSKKSKKARAQDMPAARTENVAPHQAIKIDRLTDDNALVRFIRHRPRYQETYIHQAYIHLFKTAQRRILIENSYILLDDSMSQAITDAAKRGVEITIITNCAETNDVFEMAPLTRYTYLSLMEAGIKIYEWQGIYPGKGSLHAKWAVFDDDINIIGSYNLDPRSTFLNSEDIVIIRSKKVADALRDWVKNVDLRQSKIVTMEQAKKWAKPDSPGRVWTSFAKMFWDWW
jgi:phosphatidylserine/phosphatidylglycerophosphate/cardiolipin synthase-like enzyme